MDSFPLWHPGIEKADELTKTDAILFEFQMTRSNIACCLSSTTMHDCLYAYLHKFKIVDSPSCLLCCNGAAMNAEHLFICSVLSQINLGQTIDSHLVSILVYDISSFKQERWNQLDTDRRRGINRMVVGKTVKIGSEKRSGNLETYIHINLKSGNTMESFQEKTIDTYAHPPSTTDQGQTIDSHLVSILVYDISSFLNKNDGIDKDRRRGINRMVVGKTVKMVQKRDPELTGRITDSLLQKESYFVPLLILYLDSDASMEDLFPWILFEVSASSSLGSTCSVHSLGSTLFCSLFGSTCSVHSLGSTVCPISHL
ncbi:hypothetical protein CEXT_715801 [Caerostris extrusa]|uniref:Uncharacterized protein n=1 Tax=Caerostris extrusa TaxID=172846 RepID=A0AAV4N5K7_CAEEX|nr:hypothetical protein CEXT_715801 [Caerostris extrusa]